MSHQIIPFFGWLYSRKWLYWPQNLKDYRTFRKSFARHWWSIIKQDFLHKPERYFLADVGAHIVSKRDSSCIKLVIWKIWIPWERTLTSFNVVCFIKSVLFHGEIPNYHDCDTSEEEKKEEVGLIAMTKTPFQLKCHKSNPPPPPPHPTGAVEAVCNFCKRGLKWWCKLYLMMTWSILLSNGTYI